MHMTVKRKLRWLGAATGTLVLCAVAAWLLWPDGHRITAESYERLRPGMTRAEAQDLLGGPGSTRQDFSLWLNNRSPTTGYGTDLLNEHRNQPGIEYWYQDSGIIILRFDSEDRVADQQFLQVRVSTSRQSVNRLFERLGW
jgi:hypothetical protein